MFVKEGEGAPKEKKNNVKGGGVKKGNATPSNKAGDYAARSYVGISPKRKGWCSTTAVGISLSEETKVIEPVGEPCNTT